MMTALAAGDWPATLRLLVPPKQTLPEVLAWEEAALHAVDADPSAAALILWEATVPAIVVGRSNVIAREVNVPACAADGIAVHRRSSGGGTVVVGPGCLCYALVLPITRVDRTAGIPAVTRAVMERIASALQPLVKEPVAVQGISDLTIGGQKCSGNAQRWLRQALLHHGTLLYDFDVNRIGHWLQFPSRQPDYRADRPHDTFVRPVPSTVDHLKAALTTSFAAVPSTWTDAETARVPQLLADRYALREWHDQR